MKATPYRKRCGNGAFGKINFHNEIRHARRHPGPRPGIHVTTNATWIANQVRNDGRAKETNLKKKRGALDKIFSSQTVHFIQTCVSRRLAGIYKATGP